MMEKPSLIDFVGSAMALRINREKDILEILRGEERRLVRKFDN